MVNLIHLKSKSKKEKAGPATKPGLPVLTPNEPLTTYH